MKRKKKQHFYIKYQWNLINYGNLINIYKFICHLIQHPILYLKVYVHRYIHKLNFEHETVLLNIKTLNFHKRYFVLKYTKSMTARIHIHQKKTTKGKRITCSISCYFLFISFLIYFTFLKLFTSDTLHQAKFLSTFYRTFKAKRKYKTYHDYTSRSQKLCQVSLSSHLDVASWDSLGVMALI